MVCRVALGGLFSIIHWTHDTTAADTFTQGTINHAPAARIFFNTAEIGAKDIIGGHFSS